MIEEQDGPIWRLRPAILGLIGAILAVLVHQLLFPDRPTNAVYVPASELHIALATSLAIAGFALALSLERQRWWWSAVFAVAAGAIAGLIHYWSGGGPDDHWFGDWRYASLFLAIGVALPLFQTARDEGAARFPYPEVHGHAWTNVVLWAAGWAFTGIVVALLWLLASLFDLIGLHFLHHLLDRESVLAAIVGGAYGTGIGLLKDGGRVIRLAQRVVTTVLSVLAPVLGVGLLFFLLALPFTGLGALWAATKSTTPILLGCVIGALVLANAVIGNGGDQEATNPVLRWGAVALAVAVLPLCLIAAIATGLRIGQYGLSPDRLWAIVFITLATVYGVAYWVALARGRGLGWAAYVRPSNLIIAFLIAGLGLFLATPILSFNAISTRDQVARLNAGKTAPDKFDWAALAFDFGEPGKAALKTLARSGNAAIAKAASDAASKTNRWEVASVTDTQRQVDALTKRLHVLPQATALPPGLAEKLTDWQACGTGDDTCVLFYTAGARSAVAFNARCINGRGFFLANNCAGVPISLVGDQWKFASEAAVQPSDADYAAMRAALAKGDVQVRPVQRRQLFIGGKPVGDAFD